MANLTFEHKRSHDFIARILDALGKKRMVRSEMQVVLYASKTKTLNYIRMLHGDTGQEKRIYICGYDDLPTGGRTPIYAVGNLPDAQPPKARSDSERWAQIKGNPDKHRRRKAKLAAKAAANRARIKPITWLSALGL